MVSTSYQNLKRDLDLDKLFREVFQFIPHHITGRRSSGGRVVDGGQIVDRPEDATKDGHSTQFSQIIVTCIDPDCILKIIVFLVDGTADANGSNCNIIPVFK